MPRATMSLTSSRDSDCQPAGELTVRQNRRGPTESRHEAITRGQHGGVAQRQPAWFTAPGGCRTSPPC